MSMLKNTVLIFIILCGVLKADVAYAQETKAVKKPIHYDGTPDKWRFEPIPFPLDFAPELHYQGLEELLFMPGMFKPEQKDFFSYAFVWAVEGEQPLTLQQIKKDLWFYYAGLYKAVAKADKSLPVTIENTW